MEKPEHPYECDDCGARAPLTLPGCPLPHEQDCPRAKENPMDVYRRAVEYVKKTGQPIP